MDRTRFGELKVYKANTGAYTWLFVISQRSISGELDHSDCIYTERFLAVQYCIVRPKRPPL